LALRKESKGNSVTSRDVQTHGLKMARTDTVTQQKLQSHTPTHLKRGDQFAERGAHHLLRIERVGNLAHLGLGAEHAAVDGLDRVANRGDGTRALGRANDTRLAHEPLVLLCAGELHMLHDLMMRLLRRRGELRRDRGDFARHEAGGGGGVGVDRGAHTLTDCARDGCQDGKSRSRC
jgi:hypothetical protein